MLIFPLPFSEATANRPYVNLTLDSKILNTTADTHTSSSKNLPCPDTLSWPPQHWIDRGKGQSWQYFLEDRFLTPGRLVCVTRGKLMIMAAGKVR